ncbi:MAG: UDP-3-O-[3-hydroxymyristoyl] N-acetylglucosamine deacetylase [Candidatus Aminicenantes bacterium]|nr:UDP-3-O-[3-hydroxymyristoyl] N-acetylglucosamine deacetylase [Candidatus Aminicenantes bacterium]
MAPKTTIREEISLSGIGIHSGRSINLTLKPSSAGEIILRRKDLGNSEIRIDSKKIKIKRSSLLDTKKGKIQTLEHLLAALYVFGIDSIEIELDGEEIPIMDGSALAFVQTIREVGQSSLPQEKKTIRILKSYTIQENEASLSFYPDSDFKISYSIEFDHPAIKRQELSLPINLKNFIKEIAPARTFGFLNEVPHLLKEGLALGGSLENAIVLDEERVINGPLHYPDEFVRHKILDLIGDLSLLGSPVLGHFKAHRAGHVLHLKAVRFILNNPEFWTYV